MWLTNFLRTDVGLAFILGMAALFLMIIDDLDESKKRKKKKRGKK